MQIDSTTQPNALGTTAPDREADQTELDRDAFMQLLIAQLRNQDPTNPMDTTQMMSQLTDLTSVEQLTGINERLDTLAVANASFANAQVAGFTGQTVVADTSTLRLGDLGSVQGAFELEGAADTVQVTLYDAQGREVHRLDLGPLGIGPHDFTWDGEGLDGLRAPPGRYRAEITASQDGTPVETTSRITGVVEGVAYDSGFPELVVGEHRVLMGDVREIRR